MEELEPEVLADLRQRAKVQLRKRMRALRSAHPSASLSVRSAQIVQRVLQTEVYQAAKSVALFWPILERGEVDLRELDAQARNEGKRLYYPFMDRVGDRILTGFRQVRRVDELAERGSGFLEPSPDMPNAAPGELELVVVPALAASVAGHRIGYGVGYYDATLPEFCPPAHSLIVIYDFQLLAELPVQDTDVSCEWVVTDRREFEREQAGA